MNNEQLTMSREQRAESKKGENYFLLCSLLIAILLIALLFSACEFGFDIRPEERVAGFVPVENITGVPTGGQPYISIPLSATVVPDNANNKRIEWSIANAGATASVLNGAWLTAASEGTVTVTARIANGLGGGVDYTRNFDIQISLTAIYAVQEIYGIPGALPIGDLTYTLNGKITPDNASYRNIVWSVIDDGGTGTTINGNYLAAQRKGTVRVRADIANGRLTSDYTQDFSIVISKGIVAAGYYLFDNIYRNKACFWVNGERIDLPDSHDQSYAYGIVYAGGRQFISGYYRSGDRAINLCYWVDGVQKTLPNSAVDAYYYSGLLPIAAGGAYVYILGYGGSKNPDDSYNGYYWKINANTGEVIHTAQLVGFDAYNNAKNVMVVKNDGSAVIAATVGTGSGYDSCYWLSDDGKTAIDPVIITQLDSAANMYIELQCVGLVGDEVYFAGIVSDVNYLYPYPFFYRLGASACNVSPIKNMKINRVESIVEQNGVPVFYGGYSYYSDIPAGYSWDTGWNFKDLLNIGTPQEKYLSLDTVVCSDGDVYAVMASTGYSTGGYARYTLLKEPYPYRGVEAPDVIISGIVVIEDGMLPEGGVGGITAPVWTEGSAISLTAPQVDLSGGQTITAQGWQTSDDGNSDWTEFTASTADMSLYGKYLRYYARGSSGLTYYSNTVVITVVSPIGGITAPAWRDGGAITLTAPAVDLSGVSAQGWQISDTGSGGWTNFTPPATASISHNGKFLRYYAVSGGTTYYSNTVPITVTLNPPAITTSSLLGGPPGTPYSQTLTATGGAPIAWNIQSGSLPLGLSLYTTGLISGTPTTEGTWTFTVRATNAEGYDDKQLSITISSSGTNMGSAIPLTENQWADGNLPVTNSYQWYSFTATAATQWIHVKPGTAPSLAVIVYESDGTTIVGGAEATNASSFSRTLTVGQTYYIRVRLYTLETSGTFQIIFNESVIPPGTIFIPLTENQWADGNLVQSGQQWFIFTATANTQYIHKENGTLSGLYVNVYDSDITVVGSETQFYASDRITSRTLTVGNTYYIRVRPSSGGGTGTYRIAFNTSGETPPVQLPSNAIPLTENQWANGDLPTTSDVQWFTFTATAAMQYIHVEFGALINLSVNVYDSGGTVVGSETNLSGSSTVTRNTSRTLTSGNTYYIRVRPGNVSSSGTYQIAFNTTTTAPAVQPPSNAIPLTENQWADGDLPTNGQQWFSFIATAATHYIHAANVTINWSAGGVYVQVYTSAGATSGSETRLYSSTANISRASLTVGDTYYIRVRPYSSSYSGTYRITFNKTAMPPITDTPVTLTEAQWENGNLPTSGGYQWFTFTASATTQYIHAAPGTLTDLYVNVYDSGGTVVGSETILYGTANNSRTSRTLTVGQTYYIRVRPYSSDGVNRSGTYRIAFNTSTTAPAP